MILFGGAGRLGGPLGDTWRWDGSSWSDVSPASGAPEGRFWHAMAHAPGLDRVAVFGGARDGSTFVVSDTWTWGDGAWELEPLQNPPSARREHAVAGNPPL